MFSWNNENKDENSAKIILAFGANAKLLDLTEKLKTESGKYRINMVTWLYLTFVVNVILNLSIKVAEHSLRALYRFC